MRSSAPGGRLAACALLLCGLLLPAAAQTPAAPVSDGRNAYIFGTTSRPAGPVQGDFIGAGARVVVDHPVSGDVLAAGSTVDIRAPIGDDLRASGGDVSIDSAVGGELLAAGGAVTIGRGGSVARGATVFTGKFTLSGKVDGSLEVHGEKVVIDGPVQGNVDLSAEQIELGPGARIGGRLTWASDNELKRAEGAVVTGAVTRKLSGEAKRVAEGREPRESGMSGSVFTFLGLLACAALFQLVAPAFASRSAQRVGQMPWTVAGFGVAALIATPVAAVILFITILGIPFGLILMMLYPLLMLFGFVVGAFFLADRLPAALRRSPPETLGVHMAYVAVTLLLVLLLGRIPGVGGLLVVAVMVLGMGAFAMELHARWRSRRKAAA